MLTFPGKSILCSMTPLSTSILQDEKVEKMSCGRVKVKRSKNVLWPGEGGKMKT